MSTLSPEEQEIFDVGKAAIPKFFFQDDLPQDILGGAAKAFTIAKEQLLSWLSLSYIKTAVGFWLDQHAIDRGTRRRAGESDATLAERLRQVEDAVTLPAIQAAVDGVLVASGVVGTAIIYENHQGHAFFHAGAAREAFWKRGRRWGGGPHGTRQIVILLPWGTPIAVGAAIKDAASRKKAAGYAVVVERPIPQYAPRGSVTPPAAHVAVAGGTQQFASQFYGLPPITGPVVWSVDGTDGGDATVGTISATGLYTAPATVPAGGAVDHEIVARVTYTSGATSGRARVQLH